MWGMIAEESGPYYAFINYIHIDNRVKHIYCLSLIAECEDVHQ
jgi:hypothetical protein